MPVDHSGAIWPYEDEDRFSEEFASEPTWSCPGGTCLCHPDVPPGDLVPHAIVFFDERAHRMPRARCRVFENGRLINPRPHADAGGRLELDLRPDTQVLELEWAPEDTPLEAHYPFRKQYHLNVATRRLDERVAQRLHNIGFSAHPALRDNVVDFQREYPLHPGEPSGEPADVDLQLFAFHDAALLPPLDTQSQAFDAPASLPAAPTPAALPNQTAGGGTGSAAAVHITTLTIQLNVGFALFESDFKQGADWPMPTGASKALQGALRYDLQRMVHKHGGSSRGGSWKWIQGRGGAAIRDATLTVTFVANGKKETRVETTQFNGRAVFRKIPAHLLEDLEQNPVSNLRVDVTPVAKHLNVAGVEAGPQLSDPDMKKDFLFREFSFGLHINDKGVLTPSSAHVFGNVRPRYAVITSQRKSQRGTVIELHWKPDWMLGKSEPRTVVSRLNPPDQPDAKRVPVEPAVIIHQTVSTNMLFQAQSFSKHGGGLCAHYLVDFDGHAVKMVDEAHSTPHAGDSFWQGRDGVNHFSVGIEIMHTDAPTGSGLARFPDEQLAAVVRLCNELQTNFGVRSSRYVAHSSIGITSKATFTLTRKFDPGEMFDWSLFEPEIVDEREAYAGDDPAILDLLSVQQPILKNQKTPAAEQSLRSARVLKLKELLYQIGFSVTGHAPTTPVARPGERSRSFGGSPKLNGKFDRAMELAVRAFQRRYFSGRLRRYKFVTGPGPEDPNPPLQAGVTIDAPTIKAIVEVWQNKKREDAKHATP